MSISLSIHIMSAQHGGAVFLYHPCARPEQIELLKSLARTCLRKHVVTPYRKMPVYQVGFYLYKLKGIT